MYQRSRAAAESDAATIVQLERQLRKLIASTEQYLKSHSGVARVLLEDTLATAKAHLE